MHYKTCICIQFRNLDVILYNRSQDHCGAVAPVKPYIHSVLVAGCNARMALASCIHPWKEACLHVHADHADPRCRKMNSDPHFWPRLKPPASLTLHTRTQAGNYFEGRLSSNQRTYYCASECPLKDRRFEMKLSSNKIAAGWPEVYGWFRDCFHL